jgi:hypothetical protein
MATWLEKLAAWWARLFHQSKETVPESERDTLPPGEIPDTLPSSSSKPGTPVRTVAAVRGIERCSPRELAALVQVSDSLGVNPDWLAAVISFESGWNPAARNAASGATGLIQFMPGQNGSAIRLGTTTDLIGRMSIEEQLRGVVYQYLSGFRGRMTSLDDTYLAVFYPAAIGKPDDYVVGRKADEGFSRAVYEQNAGFDRGGKGYITKADIVQTIRGVLAAAQNRPRAIAPASGLSTMATWLLLLGVLGTAAAGTLYTLRQGM